ncbi:MAG: VPLPA-CTERM sorting domain-containing protein [Methylomicrobium sp.]|nr:VPLPA-CTERM sorting domain-containing protein [Methylomicrobium sp.]
MTIKNFALISTLGLSTLMTPVASEASSAFANASLNWDSIEIFTSSFGGNPEPTIQWLNQTDNGSLSTNDNFGGGTASDTSSAGFNRPNWLSTIQRNSSLSYTSSAFDARTQSVEASASSPVEVGDYNNSSSSSLTRAGQFSVSGSGLVGFKFSASAYSNVNGTSDWSGFATSQAFVSLTNGLGSSIQSLDAHSSIFSLEIDDLSNTLVVALFFNDGQTGFLETRVSASTNLSGYSDGDGQTSPVPVPAAFWFFGTALIGLAVGKRKKA